CTMKAVLLMFSVLFGMTATLCAAEGERCFCKGNILKHVNATDVKILQLFNSSASCSKTEIMICLDPRDLNKEIKRELLKLPTREEIMAQFAKIQSSLANLMLLLDFGS
uniref:Chemokine interleukin-8-like domain-containing protein n=1 Tax=Astyanax mexicanus TaxID=7994 RepID=A0A3B1J7K5_ASTMX